MYNNNYQWHIGYNNCIQFPDVDYNGNMLSEGELKNWLSEKCVPLVREVTFENGEVIIIMKYTEQNVLV